MKISSNTVVTLRYRISDLKTGQVLEDGRQPSAYLHGGYENTFPKIEAALEGQEKGYQLTLELVPADAFGERNEALVRTIPKTQFPPGVKVGAHLEGQTETGHTQHFRVVKIKGPEVHLDGNHPLAGQSLKVELTVLDVRAASAEEVTHRHVHGEHGHHH